MQYVKIKDQIIEQIDAGMLLPRQKLPSERHLAQSFETTRVTLREALSLLEAQGRIYREDRRGWFISPPPLRYDPAQIMTFDQMALAQQRVPMTQLLNAKSMLADHQTLQLLGLKPFSHVYCIERARFLENRPVSYVLHFIRAEWFPHLLQFDLTEPLSALYAEHFGMVYQKRQCRINASSLLGKKANVLRVTPGTLAMRVERLHLNVQGDVMDCEIEYWRQDAISIESLFECSK